jgi:hypothetical protein
MHFKFCVPNIRTLWSHEQFCERKKKKGLGSTDLDILVNTRMNRALIYIMKFVSKNADTY